jgi:hypothetical protein
MTESVLPSTLHAPLITYPARPVNGGRLEDAPPKVGPWIVQPKIDDWRGVLHVPTGRVWNRHGELMTKHVTDKIDEAIKEIQRITDEYWFDIGVMERRHDILRGSIVIFDLICPELTYSNRRELLIPDFPVLPSATLLDEDDHDRVYLIDDSTSSPELIYLVLQRQNELLGKKFYEGIVCKRTDKPYPIQLLSPNKTTPWMVKHRFDQ